MVVSAMHEHVHQRAQEQDQVGQHAEGVRPMFRQQKEAADGQEDHRGQPRPGSPEAVLVRTGEIPLVGRRSMGPFFSDNVHVRLDRLSQDGSVAPMARKLPRRDRPASRADHRAVDLGGRRKPDGDTPCIIVDAQRRKEGGFCRATTGAGSCSRTGEQSTSLPQQLPGQVDPWLGPRTDAAG
jgi:hypothetical protein